MSYTMNCQKCKLLFIEQELEESHNVPCYMFEGKDRKERKQKADKHGRKLLCKKCHDIYEKRVFAVAFRKLPENYKKILILSTISFSENYFKEVGDEKR